MRRLLAAVLYRCGYRGPAHGGTIPRSTPPPDDVLVQLSPGEYRPCPRSKP
ncbi:hypothetical protein [Streptomyces sp. NPDC048669]|uniref:hypothetical protein n=1 Tax=Streptomyces sp. NPDC048669 TaxID=3155267 RepID=UPI00342EF26C